MKTNFVAVAALATLCLSGSIARADIIVNPDANTLWIEDGKNIAAGDGPSSKHWQKAEGIDITSAADGGFTIASHGDQGTATGRYIAVDPAYPYLVWEISGVTPGEGYRGFVFRRGEKGAPAINMVTNIETGIFVLPDPVETAGGPYYRLDLRNAGVTFKYIKRVKQPDYMIRLSSPAFEKGYVAPGDEVTFDVEMKEPAEDVTLSFFDSYTMPQLKINGAQKLQLKPKDKNDLKLWTATIPISEISGDRLKSGQQFGPGRILIKATILGGGIKVPLWTINPVEFRLKPTK